MFVPELRLRRTRPLFSPMDTPYPLMNAIVAVVLASGFIALSAQAFWEIRVGPVPITGQTFSVLLVGAALGSRLGAAALLLYLAEGFIGMPVFAGGNGGWAYFSGGPTGGYLVGFVAGAYVTGWLAERGWDRHVLLTALAMSIGNVAIYLCGVVRLADFVGWAEVWAVGVQPFLPGAAVKIALASGLLPVAWRIRDWIYGPTAR
ncbi:MAG: biotin transporter BioY [Dehalococcoidia bacterium]